MQSSPGDLQARDSTQSVRLIHAHSGKESKRKKCWVRARSFDRINDWDESIKIPELDARLSRQSARKKNFHPSPGGKKFLWSIGLPPSTFFSLMYSEKFSSFVWASQSTQLLCTHRCVLFFLDYHFFFCCACINFFLRLKKMIMNACSWRKSFFFEKSL